MIAATARPYAKAQAIFVRDRRVAFSYAGNFAISWASIIVEVIVAWYISKMVGRPVDSGGVMMSYFQYLAINSAFLRFQTAALNSFAEAMRDAQLTGTLEMLLAAPIKLPTLVLSSALWSFTLTAAQTATFLAVAIPFGLNLGHTNALTAVVFLILTIAAVSPLGVLAAAMAMIIKKTGPVEWISNASAMLFGGVYIPLARLPVGLQVIGWCLPITHALNGFRAASAGVTLWGARADALWLLIASIILTPLSLYLFHLAVDRARIDGTLSMY